MCFNGGKGYTLSKYLSFKTDISLVNLTTKIFVFELIEGTCELEADYIGAFLQCLWMCFVILSFRMTLPQCGHGVFALFFALILSLFF